MSLPRRLTRRALAFAGATVIGLGGLAVASSPAQADEPTVDLSVEVHSATTTLDSSQKDVRVVVSNDVSASATATNVTLTFKLPAPKAAGSIEVSDALAPNCELNAAGTEGSCVIGDIPVGGIANLNAFTVFPNEPGSYDKPNIGQIHLTVAADQDELLLDDNAVSIRAKVAKKGGVDLAAWAKRDIAVLPGKTGVIDQTVVSFTNESDVAIKGVSFFMALPTELSFTDVPAGCEVQEDLAFVVDCVWPKVKIPANGELKLSGKRALHFVVAEDAPANVRLEDAATFAGEALNGLKAGTNADILEIDSSRPADDTSLMSTRSVPEPGGTKDDNWAQFAVYTHGDLIDLTTTIEDVAAPIGNTTNLHVVVTNNGPAPAASHVVEVSIPSHAEFSEVPDGCYIKDSDATRFICESSTTLDSGANVVYTVNLTMVDVPAEQPDGRVIVTGSQADTDTLNNFDIFKVTSIENRADLALSVADIEGNPGDTKDLVLTVTNEGPAASQGYIMMASLPEHVEAGTLPDGCEFAGEIVYCASDEALAVGADATVTIPVTFVDAPDEQEAGFASIGGIAPDPNDENNAVSFLVGSTENRVDLAITVGDIEGMVGDNADLTLSVVNNGPAAVVNYLTIMSLPEHTELAELPAECVEITEDFTGIVCGYEDEVAAGETREHAFSVKLVSAPEEQLPGFAGVGSDSPETDEENNATQFKVWAKAKPVVPPGEPGGENPSLPTTGVSLTTAIGGAAAVALLGAVALFLTKRRRRATTYGDV